MSGAMPVIFHFPLAVQAVDRPARRGDAAAVHQRRITPDADEAAPRARADERADFVLLEHPRKRVAARARHFVDDHRLGSVDLRERRAEFFAFARDRAVAQRPLKQIDDLVGDFAAVVVAFVDDGRLLCRPGQNKSD